MPLFLRICSVLDATKCLPFSLLVGRLSPEHAFQQPAVFQSQFWCCVVPLVIIATLTFSRWTIAEYIVKLVRMATLPDCSQ